jgi:hypothetical protein
VKAAQDGHGGPTAHGRKSWISLPTVISRSASSRKAHSASQSPDPSRLTMTYGTKLPPNSIREEACFYLSRAVPDHVNHGISYGSRRRRPPHRRVCQARHATPPRARGPATPHHLNALSPPASRPLAVTCGTCSARPPRHPHASRLLSSRHAHVVDSSPAPARAGGASRRRLARLSSRLGSRLSSLLQPTTPPAPRARK